MNDLNFFIYSFIALFVIVDPIMNIPIFIAILEGFSREEFKKTVKRACIVGMLVLIVFTFFGVYIFKYLNIEMASFRIAGGILLLIISLEMLFGRKTKTEYSPEVVAEKREELAVTPLAIPLLTGPGAITTGIVLYGTAKSILDKLELFAAVVLVYTLSYIILSNAHRLFDILGSTGTIVIVRIMGLLLAAISVQFIVDGIRELFL